MTRVPSFLRRPASCASQAESALRPLVKLWMLRILVPMRGHRKFIRGGDFVHDDLACALGFGEMVEDPGAFDPDTARAALRTMHGQAEARASRMRLPAVMARNLAQLQRALGLSPVECRILSFAVLLHTQPLLDNAADLLGELTTGRLHEALARILDLPVREVAEALDGKGLLGRSGLLVTGRHGTGSVSSRLELLSSEFADLLSSTPVQPMDLLRSAVAVAPAAELGPADYPHLRESLAILEPYLEHVLATRRRGANIFLHGPPGTGKTQLVRMLAGRLGCPLYEVSSEDSDGDPVDGRTRLRAFRAAQTLLSQQRSVVLFDEVEDVFGGGGLFGPRSVAQERKAWMNRMLEESAAPTFWLSNAIGMVDPAFLRRFDMIIEMHVPPRSQRTRIIEAVCGDLVDRRCIERLAAVPHLAPAVVARASSVVRAVAPRLGASGAEAALQRLVDGTLQAQGHGRLDTHDAVELPGTYDLAFLNPDTSISALAEGLARSGQGRMCMYGPPGTGKTAFGHWLARRLELPLHVRRASDLLSPYLGMTEQNLAAAFREARHDRAVLMIDEVDSFLRDRREARHSWEVTGVNEMLTQMETFPGIFIASTNLVAGLDPAALRRFDLKVRMDYLTATQAVELLHRHLAALELGEPSPADIALVRQLGNLTPGDYAAIARQHRFRPVGSARGFVSLLQAESRLKASGPRPMGFVAPGRA